MEKRGKKRLIAGQGRGEKQREDDSGESLLLLLLFSRVWEHGDRKEDWEKVYSAQRIKFPFNTFSKRLKHLHLYHSRYYTTLVSTNVIL